jgi:hypothetical protein
VEAPLLACPEGSVVTLLNWMPAGAVFNSNSSMLTVDAVLGFKPSKVESVEHGVLTASAVPGSSSGAVRVSVPLASADFLLYHK